MTEQAKQLSEALKRAEFPLTLSSICLSAAMGLRQIPDDVGPGFSRHKLSELQEWVNNNLQDAD